MRSFLIFTLLTFLGSDNAVALTCLDHLRQPSHYEAARGLEDMDSLSLLTWNLKEATVAPLGDIPRKPQEYIIDTATVIGQLNADIVIAQETTLRYLNYINRMAQVGDRYHNLVIPGNDVLNIGFMIRKNLPLYIESESHKNYAYLDPETGRQTRKVFSRDRPALIIRTHKEAPPLLIIMGVHNKAEWGFDELGQPSEAARQLSKEIQVTENKATVRIANDYMRRFGVQIPIILAGDFNANLQTSPQVTWLMSLFKNAYDSVPKTTYRERMTIASYNPRLKRRELGEFDGFLHTENLLGAIESVRAMPLNAMPRSSDHTPVALKVLLRKLLLNF